MRKRGLGTRAGRHYGANQAFSKGICPTDGTGLETVQQGIPHGRRALPTLRRVLCQRPVDDLANRSRQVRRTLFERHGWLFEDGSNRVVYAGLVRQVQREGT